MVRKLERVRIQKVCSFAGDMSRNGQIIIENNFSMTFKWKRYFALFIDFVIHLKKAPIGENNFNMIIINTFFILLHPILMNTFQSWLVHLF